MTKKHRDVIRYEDIQTLVKKLTGPNTVGTGVHMRQAEIYLLGFPIQIRYMIHDQGYVEWNLVATEKWIEGEHALFNVLLRVHYTNMIEALCREHNHYIEYARSAGFPDVDEDIPF